MKFSILKKSLVICSLSIGMLFAGDYVVIVNPANGLSSIDKGELKRIFTGKVKKIDGKKVVPVNMNYDTPTAAAFLPEVTGKDVGKYKKFWVEQMIKGKGTAPMIKANVAGVKAIVSQIPGAVGYIPAADVDATVKKIDVK
ncbi:MAG: hypothetical protein OCC49_09145 [Fibrobacterales bacterium]